jgi:hypothetical protein
MVADLSRKLIAIAVLAIVAWFLLKVVIGIVTGVAWMAAVILAIVAVVWALRTL